MTEAGHKTIRIFLLALGVGVAAFFIYQYADHQSEKSCPTDLSACEEKLELARRSTGEKLDEVAAKHKTELAACEARVKTETDSRTAALAELSGAHDKSLGELKRQHELAILAVTEARDKELAAVKESCGVRIEAALKTEQMRLLQCAQPPAPVAQKGRP